MPELRFAQQLILLPATVPEYILDFLEGIEIEDPFGKETFTNSMSIECLNDNREKIGQAFKGFRETLGSKIVSVQVEPYGKEFPNVYWCKLTGETLTRGIGFLMKSKTANIIRVEFQDSDFNEDDLKKRFA